MKKELFKIFEPNGKIKHSSTVYILIIWLVTTSIIWFTSKSRLLPTPIDLFNASIDLFKNQDLLHNLLNSTFLCLKAMFYSITICYVLSTLSVLSFFKPIASFFAKSRFLTTVGLSVVFAQLSADTNGQKTSLLVFGITVFLITSFLGIIADVRKEEYDYARTLKINHWRSFLEVTILGKSDLFMEAIRQNFAIAWMMLPMVENLCRADGGIGVVLTDQNKYFHLDGVYAIQIIVLLIGIGLDWFFGYLKGMIRPDTLLALNK